MTKMNVPDARGYILDEEGFAKAREERWEIHEPTGLTHCKVHNTTFDYGQGEVYNEPCWQCYGEFEQEL